MAEFEPCAHVCAECGGCAACCPCYDDDRLRHGDEQREEQRSQWRQAASQHARDKRNQRARRPPPQISGIRVDPRRQQ